MRSIVPSMSQGTYLRKFLSMEEYFMRSIVPSISQGICSRTTQLTGLEEHFMHVKAVSNLQEIQFTATLLYMGEQCT